MRQFIRFCDLQNVEPEDVSDEITRAYRDAHCEETLAKEQRRRYGKLLLRWNEAVTEIPGWPQTKLTIPANRHRWILPWGTFPKSLTDEVERWTAWLSDPDLLSERPRVRPASAVGIEYHRYLLRAFISALVLEGRDPATIRSLRDVVDLDAYQVGLRYVLARSRTGNTKRGHIVALLLRAIARDWLKVERHQLEPMDRICRKLHSKYTGLKDRSRAQLRQFDHPQNVALIVNFPQTHLRKIQREDDGIRRYAVEAQTALAVELLLVAPVMIGILAAIKTDEHFRKSHTGAVRLLIPEHETGNRNAFEVELPYETVGLLDTYLADYHPRLTDQPNPWLFPGRDGRHKWGWCLAKQIKDRIRETTGLDMTSRAFRHLAAKLYLDAHPGGYEVIRRLLGHELMESTLALCSVMDSKAAALHFDKVVLKHDQPLATNREAPAR